MPASDKSKAGCGVPEFPDVSPEDRYSLTRGRAVLTGTQALVLLMILQRRRDIATGLNTAGFCTGYRGSPLSTLDMEFERASAFLEPLGIRHQGAVNEALAATAVWGSQQVHLDAAATVDGVFGLWYGKGAGLDQSVDVIRHANSAGTSPNGGVLAVVGDDHALKSSAQAHHCEPTLADIRVPVFYPSDIQELLHFGLLGLALSRYSGSWVGLKTLPEVVNSTAVVDLDYSALEIEEPVLEKENLNRHIQWPDPWPAGEARFHELRWPRILAFLRANRVNRTTFRAAQPRLGIVTAGKSYQDVREALAQLGLSSEGAAAAGISLYKIGCPWPLEPEGLLEFAVEQPRLFVVEEKRAVIEDQVKTILYGAAPGRRPDVFGRVGPSGQSLLPASGELEPETIALALAQLLPEVPALGQRVLELSERERALLRLQAPVERTPFFCSGCPHNTSTRLPEGSTAMGGIGCHGMAVFDPHSRTTTHTHMGGEGANWIGQAPFTSKRHTFQNLGDGTYHHSGSLAIRAAIAARVNITYKILFNDVVGMTGGQPVDGPLSVPQLAHELRSEGVARIVIVSDQPKRWKACVLPEGVSVHHRDALDAVQRELREYQGVSVLIYAQLCATEKRRLRKRERLPPADARVYIHPAVCEGCGDCSRKSNCLSVVPIETRFGRKRRIDQSACNQDFSCVKGFCPSFVTLTGAKPRKRGSEVIKQFAARLAALPEPARDDWQARERYSLLCAGIGGTGVVTVGVILAIAARLAGLAVSVHDRIGMAQKFGAVTSHIRLARSPELLGAVRIPLAAADLVLGFDLMVSAQAEALRSIGPGTTHVILNTDEAAPGAFVKDPDFDFHTEQMIENIEATSPKSIEYLAATRLATALAGDAIGTNMFLLGYAVQRGVIPLPAAALERAMELHGVAVQSSKEVFALGRLAAVDRPALEAAVSPVLLDHERDLPTEDLDARIRHRRDQLVAYQDEAYSQRYIDLVSRVRAWEGAHYPGQDVLTAAVADNYFRVLAYKDEYEVARLYSSPDFRRRLALEFTGSYRLSFHLAPPLLTRPDRKSGEIRKLTLGSWVLVLFRVLRHLKRLRGSRFDVFGYSGDRRLERQIIAEYEITVEQTMTDLPSDAIDIASRLLSYPQAIRGFGPVKHQNYMETMALVRQWVAAIQALRKNADLSRAAAREPAAGVT